MSDWTPIPGIAFSSTYVERIVGRLKEKFYQPQPDRPTPPRVWMAFPKGKTLDYSIFSSADFLRYEILNLWIENTHEVYQASPRQIAQYFTTRNPWEENWDFYIFDEDRQWCVVVTHELMNGVVVFQVGQMGTSLE